MTINRPGPKALRFALASALAAATLAGCAGGQPRTAMGVSQAEVAGISKSDLKAVRKAEEAVLMAPGDAALRAELGQLYLKVGRFDSAATAFNDAMGLGENNARTALGLALTKVALGRGREAVALLDDWRDSIPAGDLGLALALAGDTNRGVAILTDALRGGEATPKLRQNLAYAYALSGRWTEARIMMAQDVPAEELDARLTEWGATARPEQYQQRVAALLGVPLRADPGFPQQIALAAPAAAEQTATEVSAVIPREELPVESELAAVADVGGAAQPSLAQNEPEPFITAPAEPARYVPPPAPLARGETLPAASEASLASAFADMSRPAPQPQPAPRVPAKREESIVAATAPIKVSADGNQSVQLGSFSSPEGARRAWGIYVARNPELKNYQMVITPAVVRGKNYWRVAAAGLSRTEARGMCSSVKTKGYGCFAYTTGTLKTNVPGGPDRGASGPVLARRR